MTKDAGHALTRTHLWDIDKSVDPATWDLFTGESGTSEYTVTVTETGVSDSEFAVSGHITISNVGNPIPATINSVSDVITGPVNATVDCGAPFPVRDRRRRHARLQYSSNPAGWLDGTNTATATQQLHDYDEDGVASDDGTTDETVTLRSTSRARW